MPIDNELIAAVTLLRRSIEDLSAKMEAYTGICENVLDEVVPMSLAIDKLIDASIHQTAD